MAKVISGERIGQNAGLRVGCSAVIFEPGGGRILLTRRADNGRWCLPSGAMDPGESASEACEREVWEETGLHVQVVRLVGVYNILQIKVSTEFPGIQARYFLPQVDTLLPGTWNGLRASSTAGIGMVQVQTS